MAKSTVDVQNFVLLFQKCVLYWPEKRGIYGRVEVFVNNVKECDHYIIRSLTLKVFAL